MMGEKFLTFRAVEPRVWGIGFEGQLDFEILRGEQWCIIGENGSGKSTLADVICGKSGIRGGEIIYHYFDKDNKPEGVRFATDMIRKMSFESAYMMADYNNMYYQQRFNATENDWAPTVREILDEMNKAGREMLEDLTETLMLEQLFEKRLIMLSSGELRRFLIASVLLQKPQLLVIDNPFIGLDRRTVRELDSFFTKLSGMGWQMIFACPADEEIPTCVTHLIPAMPSLHPAENKGISYLPQTIVRYGKPMTRAEYESHDVSAEIFTTRVPKRTEMPQTILEKPNYDVVMRMTNINISYPKRTLFRDLNWTIKKGEKWSLSGENGAGKSTLLSLLAADNPKAYSQDIVLFDRQRGTGESIWDIKRHMGYISSEMHLFFRQDQPCLKVVASGLFDTMGLFRKPTDEQNALALEWMKMLGIEELADCSFLKVSGGEQRLVLICRTMVKNPNLLILDEPLHGLDKDHKRMVRAMVEQYAEQADKTMIYVTHRPTEVPSCVRHHYELKRLE